MRDIFNLLKHEGHEVRVIEHNSQILLGCKTCGTTLYSLEDFNVQEFLDAYKTINEQSIVSLKLSMKEFATKIVSDLKLSNIAIKINKHCIEKAENFKRYNYSCSDACYAVIFKNLLSIEMSEVYKIGQFQATKVIELLEESAIQSLLNSFREEIKSRLRKDFELLDYGQEVTYSYSKFKEESASKQGITIIFREILEDINKEYPTPTDTITVDELWKIIPNHDDEESDSQEFLEYKYRIKNNLYDFSNVSDLNLLDVLTEIIREWDYYERYSLIGDVLTDRLKRNSNEEK